EAATVALQPSPSLTGTVIPRVDVLPAGACVVVSPADGPAPEAITGDPCDVTAEHCASATHRCAEVTNGSYTIDRLRAGTYWVELHGVHGSYVTPDPVRISLAPGDLRRYEVTLERLGIVNLTVLKAGDSGSIVAVDDVP